MIIVDNIKLPVGGTPRQAVERAFKRLGISEKEAVGAGIRKVSVDARKGGVNFVYSVALDLPSSYGSFEGIPGVRVFTEKEVVFEKGDTVIPHPPLICGFGPRGMFCALALARQGFCPVVIEQGRDVDSRIESVKKFFYQGVLDPFSNIQFGEGGRGTFSDGKLITRISDSRVAYVTKTLIQHGAPEEIAYRQRPHIGTDLLSEVVKGIRQEIISLGGKVLFGTRLTDLNIKNGKLVSVETTAGQLPSDALVLATGHSAREIFRLLYKKGVNMEAKPFSVGVRIEHLQSEIDLALYHGEAGNPLLPPGEYSLSTGNNGRGVYTFCMCPGGYVIPAASEAGGVVTNGMSFSSRKGANSNSALVVSVFPRDFDGDFRRAVSFQRDLETRAFAAGGGGYKAPRQTVGIFMEGRKGLELKRVAPTYPLGVVPRDLASVFPKFILDGLRRGISRFEGKIKGFAAPDSVLTGVESRTSSPVRIKRDELFQSNIRGLYPAGEGAGYSGGIMSSAVDGIRVAQRICSAYRPG